MVEAFLPFRTERLLVRAFTADDAPVLAAYRDHPDVARLQDWPLPYTVDMARQRIAASAGIPGPVVGEWVQLALDLDGELVGDLAVGLDGSGLLASIGYSLRPEHQGRGLMREAAGALVDRLFTAAAVQRISATLDPANIASARLLEDLGFRYEGRSLRAALVRGSLVDDDHYGLLPEDRTAWLARPTSPPSEVRLVELGPDNARTFAALGTHRSQERFVSTVVQSYRDALFPEVVDGRPLQPWLRGIEADGEPVGFVMVAEATEAHPEPYLWRFLVDRRHQRRGIGRMVLGAVFDRLRAEGCASVLVSWVEGPGGPGPLYRSLGFEPTGRVVEAEVEARLVL